MQTAKEEELAVSGLCHPTAMLQCDPTAMSLCDPNAALRCDPTATFLCLRHWRLRVAVACSSAYA